MGGRLILRWGDSLSGSRHLLFSGEPDDNVAAPTKNSRRSVRLFGRLTCGRVVVGSWLECAAWNEKCVALRGAEWFMLRTLKSAWRLVLLSLVLAGGLGASVASAGLVLPLAQVTPAAPAPLPSNVSVPGRMYIVEGIVVAVLFGGAIFSVCRASGRT